MKTLPLARITRRSFLGACAGAAGAAACLGPAASSVAFAQSRAGEGDIGPAARPRWETTHSICAACAHGCGFTAYVVDGKLNKAIGDGLNPQSVGTLCARGFGYTQSIYDHGVVKAPQLRKSDGSFQTVSWDTALKYIGDSLKSVRETNGAGAVALIYNGASSTAAAYGPRLMRALGSGNTFVNDVTFDINKAAAYTQVIGVSEYTPDIEAADLVLLVDTSYADITTPSLSAALQGARAKGTPIVAVDSRLGAVAQVADTWVGVNPGTELALLLAVCNQLISTGRYDRNFVANNASGFDEWATQIADYTPAWAQDITGVESFRIEDLASRLADAAPRVAIEYGNGNIGQASFVNSAETARVVCLLNMLLGTWGEEGGALMPFDFSAVGLDAVMGASAGGKGMLGTTRLAFGPARSDFPLGVEFGASAASALMQEGKDAIKALFAIESNIAYDYAAVPDLDKKLASMKLVVSVSSQMDETAMASHVVLPAQSYLASGTLPKFTSGKVASVSIASAAVAIDDNALPLSTIFEKIADVAGAGAAFNFTQAEAAEAQLGVVGLTLEGLQAEGCAQLTTGEVARIKGWATETGKIQCVSEACANAGLPPAPIWVPTYASSNIALLASEDMHLGQANLEMLIANAVVGKATKSHGKDVDASHAVLPVDGHDRLKFHLITGPQTVIGEVGANTSELMDIAEQYELDSVWINADIAELMDIKTGDKVGIASNNNSGTVRAYVTQRIVPTAVYLPSGFGHSAIQQDVANGVGVNAAKFSPPLVESGYGTLCTQEACVWLWKEGV